MTKYVGILTAGGDSPGLNAAIRSLGKTALGMGMQVIGFRDGFRGLMENRTFRLDSASLSGILTVGGTILGTSREKPFRMPVGGHEQDMTDVLVENYHKHHLDVLACLGGGGTVKNAYHLMQHGLNVIILPKTIDNDVFGTDTTLGFDTALGIATEAVDRLHSTAHSHHRIIIVEIMGHNAGWLALGAGMAGGADVILLPEIPYEVGIVAQAVRERSRSGKGFSIIAVAEGAVPKNGVEPDTPKKKKAKKKPEESAEDTTGGHTLKLAQQLEQLTGLESRVTILGYVQRGGTPSAVDRLLGTRLGSAAAELIKKGQYGVMVAARGDATEPVPLRDVVGQRRTVSLDHSWIQSARQVGTCLGD
jgi:ATP-dependent phosphofructokinase / diphosphate-dependent phosphofructokinase